MATPIQVSPGTSFPTITLVAYDSVGAPVAGNLIVTALKDLTITNSNDVFSWTQLDNSSKLQLPTTATNSISTNFVVDETLFFGNAAATTGSATKLGLVGLSKAKTKCAFTIPMGTKSYTGDCYVTGLASTVSADAPVWVTPITFTVTGEYTIA